MILYKVVPIHLSDGQVVVVPEIFKRFGHFFPGLAVLGQALCHRPVLLVVFHHIHGVMPPTSVVFLHLCLLCPQLGDPLEAFPVFKKYDRNG